jgi:hypothetical protein
MRCLCSGWLGRAHPCLLLLLLALQKTGTRKLPFAHCVRSKDEFLAEQGSGRSGIAEAAAEARAAGSSAAAAAAAAAASSRGREGGIRVLSLQLPTLRLPDPTGEVPGFSALLLTCCGCCEVRATPCMWCLASLLRRCLTASGGRSRPPAFVLALTSAPHHERCAAAALAEGDSLATRLQKDGGGAVMSPRLMAEAAAGGSQVVGAVLNNSPRLPTVMQVRVWAAAGASCGWAWCHAVDSHCCHPPAAAACPASDCFRCHAHVPVQVTSSVPVRLPPLPVLPPLKDALAAAAAAAAAAPQPNLLQHRAAMQHRLLSQLLAPNSLVLQPLASTVLPVPAALHVGGQALAGAAPLVVLPAGPVPPLQQAAGSPRQASPASPLPWHIDERAREHLDERAREQAAPRPRQAPPCMAGQQR